MRKPDRGAIRVTHDVSSQCSIEVWDGAEWRWIGTLTELQSGYLFSSSDDSMRVVYDDYQSAVEALLTAGARGRL